MLFCLVQTTFRTIDIYFCDYIHVHEILNVVVSHILKTKESKKTKIMQITFLIN
jgi:hypothetical protein